jgi:hypothetical protein
VIMTLYDQGQPAPQAADRQVFCEKRPGEH